MSVNYGTINVSTLPPTCAQDTVLQIAPLGDQPGPSHSWPEGFCGLPWEAISALGPIALFLATILYDRIRLQRERGEKHRLTRSFLEDSLSKIVRGLELELAEMTTYVPTVDFFGNSDAPLKTVQVPYAIWLAHPFSEVQKTFIRNTKGEQHVKKESLSKVLGLLTSIQKNSSEFLENLNDMRRERAVQVERWNEIYTRFNLLLQTSPAMGSFVHGILGEERLAIRRTEETRIRALLQRLTPEIVDPIRPNLVVVLNQLAHAIATLVHLEERYRTRLAQLEHVISEQASRLKTEQAFLATVRDVGFWAVQ